MRELTDTGRPTCIQFYIYLKKLNTFCQYFNKEFRLGNNGTILYMSWLKTSELLQLPIFQLCFTFFHKLLVRLICIEEILSYYRRDWNVPWSDQALNIVSEFMLYFVLLYRKNIFPQSEFHRLGSYILSSFHTLTRVIFIGGNLFLAHLINYDRLVNKAHYWTIPPQTIGTIMHRLYIRCQIIFA